MPGPFIGSRRAVLFGSGATGAAAPATPATAEQFIVAPGIYVNEGAADRQFMVAPGVYVNEVV